MTKIFFQTSKIFASFLILFFALSQALPALADVGLTVRTPIAGTKENVIYGNATNASGGNSLMLLQNLGKDMFKVDRSGYAEAMGAVSSTKFCLSNTCYTTWSQAGVLPAGSNGNTLYYNGGWLAGNNIYNAGGNIGIGTTVPGATYRLDVEDGNSGDTAIYGSANVGVYAHSTTNASGGIGLKVDCAGGDASNCDEAVSARGGFNAAVIAYSSNSAASGVVATGGKYGISASVYPSGSAGIAVFGSQDGIGPSISSAGVYGSGSTYGVYGNSATYGVYGNGATYGVYGYGTTYSVYGLNNSSAGYGVYGSATGDYGTGVWGSSSGNNSYGVIANASGTGSYNFYTNTNAPNYFAGNVGINTAPSYRLSVNGAANNWSERITNSGGAGQNYGILIDAGSNTTDSPFRIRNSGYTDEFIVLGNGNVGIGTTNPQTTLTVIGSIALKPPITTGASTYIVQPTDSTIISSYYATQYTLPAAASYPGRILHFGITNNNHSESASNNVVLPGTVTPQNEIINTSGGWDWSILQSDGTNWIMIARGM